MRLSFQVTRQNKDFLPSPFHFTDQDIYFIHTRKIATKHLPVLYFCTWHESSSLFLFKCFLGDVFLLLIFSPGFSQILKLDSQQDVLQNIFFSTWNFIFRWLYNKPFLLSLFWTIIFGNFPSNESYKFLKSQDQIYNKTFRYILYILHIAFKSYLGGEGGSVYSKDVYWHDITCLLFYPKPYNLSLSNFISIHPSTYVTLEFNLIFPL